MTTELQSLPDGWRWVRLGDLSSDTEAFADGPFGSHLKTEHYSSSGARVIRLQNIGRGTFLDQDKAYVSLDHFANLGRHSVQAGDIMVAALGDGVRPAGRACILPDGIGPALAKADCFRIRLPRAAVHPAYLTSYLNSPEALARIAGTIRGATRPRLTLSMLRATWVPLPPAEEQQWIARKLGEQVVALERARAAAEAQAHAAQILPAAFLRSVFASPEAQRWPRQKLGEVSEIVSGITLGRPLNGSATRRVSYLRVANVKDGHLDLSDVYEIEASEVEIARLRLRSGDLLLTEGGDPDKLGRGTIWRDEIAECVHQNHIFRVRFDLTQFAPDFVSAQVGSHYGKAYFLAHAKRTTGIATINRKVLAAFPVMTPSRAEQERMAHTLAAQRAAADHVRRSLKARLEDMEAMRLALLRRAFSGEL